MGSSENEDLPLSAGWSRLGGESAPARVSTREMNPQTNILYAAGSNYKSTNYVGTVNQWNGSNWAQIVDLKASFPSGEQQNSYLIALAISPSSGMFYVSGYSWIGVYQYNLTSNSGLNIGLSFSDIINSLAVDSNDNVYAAGTSYSGTYQDTYLYSDLGSGKKWYTIGQQSASICNIGIDSLNNVYDTTYSESGGSVWKYNAQTDIWVQKGSYFPGTAQQVAFSTSGNIYVGSSDSANNPQKGGVWTWNGNVWTKVGGSGYLCADGSGNVGSVAVDNSGNIYAVCGSGSIGGYVYVHKAIN